MSDKHRKPGAVRSVSPPFIEDHGILTTNVYVDLDECGTQGFGGLALNPILAKDYVARLCATFGVKDMSALVGKKCYALYSFDGFNELIEGLESADTGHRFLHNAWRRLHFPETKSVYAQKVESIQREIAHLRSRCADEEARLMRLRASHVDWESL